MRKPNLIAASFAGIYCLTAVPSGFGDSSQVTGQNPGVYGTANLQAAQAEVARLQALSNSGQTNPTQFATGVNSLGTTTKVDMQADTVQSAPPIDNGGIGIPLPSGTLIDNGGAAIPLDAPAPSGTKTSATVCIQSNGNNGYTVQGPKQSFGWNGPQCFTVTDAGNYCLTAPGGAVGSITATFSGSAVAQTVADNNCINMKTPGETVTFNLNFNSPQPAAPPVPITAVLNNLYYYDGYKAIPLKDELKNVYYDDGSAKGIPIMNYLDQISIHPDAAGHYSMPPALSSLFVKINGVDKPLTDYVAKLNFVDSYGTKFPIAKNLHNIVAIQSASSPTVASTH